MLGLNLVPRLVVVLSFVLLVESDTLKGLGKAAMSHQLLQDRQSDADLAQLSGEGVPQSMGGISQMGKSGLLEENFPPHAYQKSGKSSSLTHKMLYPNSNLQR